MIPLDRYRPYLLVLAQSQLRPGDGLEASDLVQQTLLDAHHGAAQFRGTTEAEAEAWLRKLLACNLVDALRHQHRDRRDIRREESLDAAIDGTSTRLHDLVPAWRILLLYAVGADAMSEPTFPFNLDE